MTPIVLTQSRAEARLLMQALADGMDLAHQAYLADRIGLAELWRITREYHQMVEKIAAAIAAAKEGEDEGEASPEPQQPGL